MISAPLSRGPLSHPAIVNARNSSAAGLLSPPEFKRPTPSNTAHDVVLSRNAVILVAASVGVTRRVPADPSGRTTCQSRSDTRPLKSEATSKSNSTRAPPGSGGPDPWVPSPVSRSPPPVAVQLTVNGALAVPPAVTLTISGFVLVTVQLLATASVTL
jgi:hypothetical protein